MSRTNQAISKVFQPPSQMDWTDDKLAALSNEQLVNLLTNLQTQREAGRVSAAEADDLARRITTRLPARALAARVKRPRAHVLLEERVADELRGLAASLARRYDLSAETARAQSRGVKGFKPLAMTDKRGAVKAGDSMKDGRMAIDRYISYRVRDSLATLAFLLAPDQPAESGRYVLLATDDLLQDGAPPDEFPAAKDYGWSEACRARLRAVKAADFAEAQRLYEELIARVATPLP